MSLQPLIQGIAKRALAFAQPQAEHYAEGTMNSLVRIFRNPQFVFNETTRLVEPANETVVYDDVDFPGFGAPAGITPATGPVTMEIGDEPQYYSNATVYIPVGAAFLRPQVDDIVQVMANQDADFIRRMLRVVDVPDGGRIQASQQLTCVGVQPSSNWTAPVP